jgi:hypothetical protein
MPLGIEFLFLGFVSDSNKVIYSYVTINPDSFLSTRLWKTYYA